MAKRKDYISWDECFMRMSHVIAQRSKDPSTQAGAVIVDENKIILGVGYNGFPRGVHDDDISWERDGGFVDTKYAYVVHAEANAVYNSNADTKGSTLYCTLFPCNECSKAIIQKGIKEIIYESDKYHDEEQWEASRKMLDLAGIKYKEYKSDWSKE